MTKVCAPFIGAVFAMAPAVFGQAPQSAGIVYQQAGAFGFQTGPGAPAGASIAVFDKGLGPELLSPQNTAGSPFSAARQSHSLQVLGDGTRIERSEASQYYRDTAGRTRVETGASGSERIVIQDPVGGFVAILDPASRTAQKLPAPPAPPMKTATRGQVTKFFTQEVRSAAGGNVVFTQGAIGATIAGPVTAGSVTATIANSDAAPKPTSENLGTQNVGGVNATGQRTTLTIPAGQIGNDRPIQVASETWYSSDLQMVVKSSNSDPRFGDAQYSLTNINRTEPDASLFQIPSDYTVSEAKNVQFNTTKSKE